jgi:predicted nuclease of predicted toxin-antitoxin system
LAVESADPLVIAEAQELDAILLSMNGDFADLLRYPPNKYKGIVALQMRNHPEVSEQLISRFLAYCRGAF